MTVIAWRNGIMACDSCWSSRGTQNCSMVKIRRLSSGALLGTAGDNDSREMEKLLDKIKSPDKLPTRQELIGTKLSFEGLLALPRGGVWMISCDKVDAAGFPDNPDDDMGLWLATSMGGYAACGSGGDFALAAMDAGATAREAVEIACRREIHCRGPVHARKLFDDKHPTPRSRRGKPDRA